MCDWRNRHQAFAPDVLDGKDNDAGAIFDTLFPAQLMFRVPEVGVGNNQAAFR